MRRLARMHSMMQEKRIQAVLNDFEASSKQGATLDQYSGNSEDARDVATTLMRICSDQADVSLARRIYEQTVKEKRMSAATCNMYLQCLVMCNTEKHFPLDEARKILTTMKANSFAFDAHTYQSILEIHYRSGLDVSGVWKDMRDRKVAPTQLSLRSVLGPAALVHTDPVFVLEVVREMVDRNAIERRLLNDIAQNLAQNENASPDQVLFVLFELEQQCVMEKVSVRDTIPAQTLLHVLIKCALRGDADCAELLLGLFERHHFAKGGDMYGLMVYCYSVAARWKDALDLVQEMANRGLLDNTDAQKRFIVEGVKYAMDRHYLNALAHTLSISTEHVDAAYFYIEERRTQGHNVSIHCLDVIVLACAKLSDEQRAIETIESYDRFDLKPRGASYLYLLQACGGKNKARHQKTIFEAMIRNGVDPNTTVYKLLVRQALAADHIGDALEFVERMAESTNARLDGDVVEHVIDKASRVGDVDLIRSLVVKASKEWNVRLDVSRLQQVVRTLNKMGADTAPLLPAVALHEEANK
eukprot:PhM_4_TR3120/c0_g1_i1/m.69622